MPRARAASAIPEGPPAKRRIPRSKWPDNKALAVASVLLTFDRDERRTDSPRRSPHGENTLEEVGTVSQRAAVGHRSRGLQRRWQRVGLLQPRSGALARLPLGRGRPRGHFRRSPAAL